MPCFKGLAVSIHTPDGPLAEHGIQKQSRASRISSYIPVPPAKIPENSITQKAEQSTFAISITLLTPGIPVPYSTPKPTPDNPYPRAREVGSLPGVPEERGNYGAGAKIPPYNPRTGNQNETIAAYIYFDGRAKEEVATLLRRGEETWVNSRWVSVPETEGGGLAEREFIFREVGLERWLNGLDLEGTKDRAERIERRQRRLEKKRRRKIKQESMVDSSDEEDVKPKMDGNGVLKYGGENGSPVKEMQDESGLFSSDSDSDDEPPEPEAAGQIKVALFRVLASGEIKRGEYSPQFDVHEDEDGGTDQNGNADGGNDDEIDHTTSFAKPKTLDPKTISTQTVTGIDPPESPYATFTFFYRGAKQLQKMNILQNGDSAPKTPASSKRKTSGPDFSHLGPLQSTGTVGFSGYRDSTAKRKDMAGKVKDEDAMDSDHEDEDVSLLNDGDNDVGIKDLDGKLLSPEDARREGVLAEGVQKIKLKRQHSAEPLNSPQTVRKSPHINATDSPAAAGTPQSVNSTSANAGTPPGDGNSPKNKDANGTAAEELASPSFKRHRASMPGLDSTVFSGIGGTSNNVFPTGSGLAGMGSGADTNKGEEQHRALSTPEVRVDGATGTTGAAGDMEEDEEL